MAEERRAQSKVKELGLEDLVNEMLARGVTYEQIAEICKQQRGVEIGKSSIARYNDKVQRRLKKIAETREAAQAMGRLIAEKTGNEPDTEMSELLLGAMQHMILDKLGEEELTTKETVGLVIAGSQTVKAAQQIEKLKQTQRERATKAWNEVMAQSKELLEKSGLWPQVEAVLAAGRARAIQE